MADEEKQSSKEPEEPELKRSDEELEDLNVPEAEAEAAVGGGSGSGKVTFNPFQITHKT
jgi:hypothetical protein